MKAKAPEPARGILHDAVGLWTEQEVREVQMARLALIKKRYEEELRRQH
jgi:hypothetical protein